MAKKKPGQKTFYTHWSSAEDEILISMYNSATSSEIAAIVNRTPLAVRSRCGRLGLNSKHLPLSKKHEAEIVSFYEKIKNTPKGDFSINELAAELGVTADRIGHFAKKMGLTKRDRKISEKSKEHLSESIRGRLEMGWKPKGTTGYKFTEEQRKKQSINQTGRVLSKEKTEAKTAKMNKTKMERYGTAGPRYIEPTNAYSRSKGGRRADLDDRYFRSSWEANYARYLNWLILQRQISSWQFECQTFVFHGITRGVMSYMPDFKVINNDGSHEWHEVKGWMDARSRVKLKRMAKYYPEERVIVIDQKEYKAISKWKAMIPNWE